MSDIQVLADFSRLDPKPSVLMLHRKASADNVFRNRVILSLGFSAHKQTVLVEEKSLTPFFDNCTSCTFNQIYQSSGNQTTGCPGGITYLQGRNQEDFKLPLLQRLVKAPPKYCKKNSLNGTRFRDTKKVAYIADFPDYILSKSITSTYLDSYPLRAFLANPNAERVGQLDGVIPFYFANVNSVGEVCLGSSKEEVDWINWSTIQNAFLNFERNLDWTEFWYKKVHTHKEYLDRLSAEGATFVNSLLSDTDVEGWESKIPEFMGWSWDTMDTDKKLILPFDNNTEKIIFERENHAFYFVDNCGNKTLIDWETADNDFA